MSSIEVLVFFAIIAALLNMIDTSIGMGYGTSLTIIFILSDYDPGLVVLPILISGVIAGIFSSLFHVIFKNLELKRTEHIKRVTIQLDKSGEREDIKISLTSRRFSVDAKIVMVFTASGVASATMGATMLSSVSGEPLANFVVKIYIGFVVLILGVMINRSRKRSDGFSFKKVVLIGGIAGFNKSISGGGFGPVAMAGQMILGREGRRSIGTTSLSETIISIASIIMYMIISSTLDSYSPEWLLALALTVGACSTSPIASYIASRVDKERYKRYLAFGLVLLSILTFSKLIIIDPFMG